MTGCCASPCETTAKPDRAFRRVLWVALVINVSMFLVESAAGVRADSASLLADAADFLGDAVNYGVSLFVLGLAPVWRSRAAAVKGVFMGLYGLVVLAMAAYNVSRDALPDPVAMGGIGLLALMANLTVAALLYRFRRGDANMRSVWLCTRNDVIGNVAVMLAAVGVFGTGTGWPDLVVASIMAVLGLWAATQVLRQAGTEMEGWFRTKLSREAGR